ncbi:MAG: hypothetical protein HFE28_04730 [Clostridia bacterium]|jgi:cell division protein FtsL|nr:hypothetical protein [Clostridia bacterium]
MATTIERNTKGQPEFTNSSDPEWVHNARMEEYRKVLYFGKSESDVLVETAPEKPQGNAEPVEIPSAARRIAEYHAHPAPLTHRNLFEDVAIKNGELVSTISAPEAVAAVPAAPTVAPAPVILPDSDDADARPTPRTMASLNTRTETEQGFFSSLSTRAKVVLAAVAAAIVLVIALICINTAIINSINADIADKQAVVNDLKAQAQTIRQSIEEITNVDSINEWAESVGMQRP